jgi:hypothetical protein
MTFFENKLASSACKNLTGHHCEHLGFGYGLMTTFAGPVSVTGRMKSRIKYWLKNFPQCLLYNTVTNRRNAKFPCSATRFGYLHPLHWLRPITFGLQFVQQHGQILFLLSGKFSNGLPIYSGSPF